MIVIKNILLVVNIPLALSIVAFTLYHFGYSTFEHGQLVNMGFFIPEIGGFHYES